ncbi:UDP-N-acetylenolpyruvoylglucosamine reductase [Thermohalobacter berrensis]|uniref:UDP-N-acetylenolpyruvoylglucosamine reductase n=1 Tax=Thermohalobacter berrensis TaxID=99594 RepID=A0A419SY08_9FIRM|nr:UDP-N-acetylenolpyruvoylglucosamine reductase [Thermohalobacter berrensis]
MLEKEVVYNNLKGKIIEGTILLDEPMKDHTSFKIGGPVDIMVLPKNIDEISNTVKFCKENNINFYIIGNGSNLLVSDKGIRGLVIKISENFSDIKVEGNRIIAQAGILLSKLSKVALRNSLKGLEFASGIPGSLGGAITMNAGAYGGEMKDVVKKVKCMDRDGNVYEYTNEEMDFGYRKSLVQKKNLIVLEVEMELCKGDYNEIKEEMDILTEKRNAKQPLSMPSAGSTFKRPKGHYAGKLIQDAGLKGLKYGNAQVSDLHSGFIVNIGNATCEEVLTLIKIVQKTVKDKFGVELEPEVKIIGEE